MKRCHKCKETKPLEEFYNCKRQKDGKQQKCICCVKNYDARKKQERIDAGEIIRDAITKEQIQYMVEQYNLGRSCEDIGKEMGFVRSTVRNNIKRSGINVRHKNFKRKHKIKNEDYFEMIDSERKAYFLGLLWADGCNYIRVLKGKHAHQTVISLKEEDKHILEEFCLDIYENTNILSFREREKPRKNQWTLRISSVKMSNDLINLGMMPRKSVIVDWPQNLPDYLIKHFIRGVYDGDGGISFNTNSRNYTVGIISSVLFINELKSILDKHLNYSFHISEKIYPKTGTIMKNFKIHGNDKCAMFLDWLYDGATVKLNRKYQKYLELKDRIKKRDLSKLSRSVPKNPSFEEKSLP